MITCLPYDAEVEYLQNTGLTQFVDTGIVPDTGFRVNSRITPLDVSVGDKWLIGAWNSGARYYPVYMYPVGRWGGGYGVYFQGSTVAVAGTPIEMDVEYTASYQIVMIDGTVVQQFAKSGYSGTSARSVYLFGLNDGSRNVSSFLARMGATKIWMNGALVRDFVPVRFTNSNGQSEGAMYDRVSRKLFRNAGTGAFTIGPDVATPVMGLHFMKLPKKTARNYVQDGLVAMWDGIENAGWGVHDNSATTWKDLIGGHVLNVDNGGSWADDCLVCDGTRRGAYGNNLTGGAPLVVEAVVQATTASSWRILWHQGEWRDGLRLTRCLVFYNPTQLWLASAYGYTDVSTTIANKTTIHIDYASSGISHLSINGSDAAFSTGATSWYNTDGGNVFAFGGASSTSANYALACKIYSFRLYSRALTADEIAHNYAVDKERFNLP